MTGREMADALEEVLKDQSQRAHARREEASKKKKSRKTAPLTWAALAVSSAVSAYIWLGNPAWLEPGPPSLPPVVVEAGLRMEVFQLALSVEAFRDANGRLPRDLLEIGDTESGISYAVVEGGAYRLAVQGPNGDMAYLSTDSLELFLGDAVQVIRGGT